MNIKISKDLSKHLRHQPERLGIQLAPGGSWANKIRTPVATTGGK